MCAYNKLGLKVMQNNILGFFFFNDGLRLEMNLTFGNVPTNHFLNSFRMNGCHQNLPTRV